MYNKHRSGTGKAAVLKLVMLLFIEMTSGSDYFLSVL